MCWRKLQYLNQTDTTGSIFLLVIGTYCSTVLGGLQPIDFTLAVFQEVRRAMRKMSLGHMQTAKALTRLRIRAVWSGPSLPVQRNIGYCRIYSGTSIVQSPRDQTVLIFETLNNWGLKCIHIFQLGLQNDFELLRILNFWSLNYRGSIVLVYVYILSIWTPQLLTLRLLHLNSSIFTTNCYV